MYDSTTIPTDMQAKKADSRPIGVFDSGLGGLTAVRELQRILPHEDIIYFGDTARVPYGSRSKETIVKYAHQDIAFLLKHNIKAIVIACGTVSTAASGQFTDYGVPVIGVVEPAVARAAEVTENGRVGLIATQAAISSGAYTRAMSLLRQDVEVTSQACPLLVPIVEAGRIHKGDIIAETLIREYLTTIKQAGADTLILGCTHYPLLSGLISDFLGEDVKLVSSGERAAIKMASLLAPNDIGHTGVTKYYVSDNLEGFTRLASLFLSSDITQAAECVDIDKITL